MTSLLDALKKMKSATPTSPDAAQLKEAIAPDPIDVALQPVEQILQEATGVGTVQNWNEATPANFAVDTDLAPVPDAEETADINTEDAAETSGSDSPLHVDNQYHEAHGAPAEASSPQDQNTIAEVIDELTGPVEIAAAAPDSSSEMPEEHVTPAAATAAIYVDDSVTAEACQDSYPASTEAPHEGPYEIDPNVSVEADNTCSDMDQSSTQEVGHQQADDEAIGELLEASDKDEPYTLLEEATPNHPSAPEEPAQSDVEWTTEAWTSDSQPPDFQQDGKAKDQSDEYRLANEPATMNVEEMNVEEMNVDDDAFATENDSDSAANDIDSDGFTVQQTAALDGQAPSASDGPSIPTLFVGSSPADIAQEISTHEAAFAEELEQAWDQQFQPQDNVALTDVTAEHCNTEDFPTEDGNVEVNEKTYNSTTEDSFSEATPGDGEEILNLGEMEEVSFEEIPKLYLNSPFAEPSETASVDTSLDPAEFANQIIGIEQDGSIVAPTNEDDLDFGADDDMRTMVAAELDEMDFGKILANSNFKVEEEEEKAPESYEESIVQVWETTSATEPNPADETNQRRPKSSLIVDSEIVAIAQMAGIETDDEIITPDTHESIKAAESQSGNAAESTVSVGVSPAIEPAVPRRTKPKQDLTQFETALKTAVFDPTIGTQVATLCEKVVAECPSTDQGTCVFLSCHSEKHIASLIGCMGLIHATGNKKSVLLVDGNVSSRNLSLGFGRGYERGFSDACMGKANWKSLVQPTNTPRLAMIPAGDAYDEFLDRSPIITLLSEMSEEYDLVLVDGGKADSAFGVPLCTACDRAYLVVRLGKTNRDVAASTVEMLQGNGVDVHGIVATNVPSGQALKS